MEQQALARTAGEDADYLRLGIAKDRIEPWEDGARTDNSAGTYEWWYFDAHLSDGSKVVVSFLNKMISEADKPLDPTLMLNLDLPDGRSFEKVAKFEASEFSAAKDHAEVRFGDNSLIGDLRSYRIVAEIEEVSVDFTLQAEVPSWRPKTGHMYFGPGEEKLFAWLPSVPQGKVTGSFTVAGQRAEVTGVGYHDHNWGNVGLPSVIHDWYWARGQAGPYSVIASYITAHEKFGYEAIPIFMLAQDGTIIADDSKLVRFETEDIRIDDVTAKPVANITRYSYDDGADRYQVTFTRKNDLSRSKMIDDVHGPKRVLAKLARFDGAYLRFSGELSIKHFRDSELIEEYQDEAIWELMYFGHAR
ncbi:hypothetical protein FHU41_000158 [Psychromicrobium silvestre]|uniref:Diels-Alderase N-terminal domain-containing protein n=1 Tax=Psychromicrobium silvestre TaxID=1645614 RepID=A0A7Y9S658_9MICC|nr:lipocalin-like domain-containing protein [Psychromicrobium silvestre]NYE93937.1 hypothetical protein [Psychromicrobium silvestre]